MIELSFGQLAVLALILLAEFVNGATDAPNAIATVVSTRVLTPTQAIIMAAVLNAAGAHFGNRQYTRFYRVCRRADADFQDRTTDRGGVQTSRRDLSRRATSARGNSAFAPARQCGQDETAYRSDQRSGERG